MTPMNLRACVIALLCQAMPLLAAGDIPQQFQIVPADPWRLAQKESSPPTNDAFQRLAVKARASNHSGPLGPITTHLLGLTGPNEQLPVYQLKAELGSDTYFYNIAADGSGRVVLFGRLGEYVYAFAFDPHLSPTAAIVRYREQPYVSVAIDSVRPQLHQMLGFWVDWINRQP